MKEQELLSLAKAGDREAMARLLHDAYPIVYGYLVKLTLDKYLAEDLTQRTMIRALERLSTFRGESKLSTWLVKIATNLYRDQLRGERRKRGILAKVPLSTEPDPSLRAEILSALSQLSPKLREPILLKYYCATFCLFSGFSEQLQAQKENRDHLLCFCGLFFDNKHNFGCAPGPGFGSWGYFGACWGF